jgi:hypothetical protein
VVAVGGTRLSSLGAGGAWAGESVWNGQGAGGGGCSTRFPAQPWQAGVADWPSVGCGTHRAVADLSADADPYSGVAIYDSSSECPTHWCTIGGTSLSSPLIASVFALAGGAHGVAYPAKTIYESAVNAPGTLHDITLGSNGACSRPPEAGGLSGCTIAEERASCASTLICLASSGYDGPTGVGTPAGIAAFAPGAREASKNLGGGEAKPPNAGTNPNETSKNAGEEEAGGATNRPPASQPLIQITTLRLTGSAISALHHRRPKASQVAFVFTITASAHVRATLARRVRVHGHMQWQKLAASLTVSATRGRNSARLRTGGTLPPGRYELVLTPASGKPRTLVFHVG